MGIINLKNDIESQKRIREQREFIQEIRRYKKEEADRTRTCVSIVTQVAPVQEKAQPKKKKGKKKGGV